MKHLIELPDAAFLQACFRYEPETGKLFWKERPKEHFPASIKYWERFCRLNVGNEVGTKVFRPNGDKLCLRLKLSIFGRKIIPSVHRVIFALLEIPIPDGHVIDHRNGDPFDNRFENLRIATVSQNCCNKKNQRRASDLPKGVARCKRKFRAHCMINGKAKVIGAAYATAEEAHKAYCDYASKVHGEFFRAS